MKMKVIFLDIDGVLNTNSDREISNDKLKLLSELVSKTGADVVLDDQNVFDKNLVQTNGDIGLTQSDCQKASQLLN